MLSRVWPAPSPSRACLLLGLPLLMLVWLGIERHAGLAFSLQALFSPSLDDIDQLLLHQTWWPRLAMALLAGGGLALAGVLLQQVLRNPLASPTTLGVAAGANLALMAATLLAPGLLVLGREWVALGGGALAVGLVFLLSWPRGLAPVVVVLSGLVVNFYLGALATALLLFNHESLVRLLIWGAGSLVQNGWDDVAFLWPRLLVGAALAWLLLRPLAILELDDASARSLGVSLKYLRLGGLGLAVVLTGSIVSVVGVIGFIGLAAPNIVRLAGGRSLAQRLVWGTLLGALLLALTDLVIQLLGGELVATMLPTGAITGLLGAPLLLWLIPRLRLERAPPQRSTASLEHRHPAPRRLAIILTIVLLLAAVLAIVLGQGPQGWYWLTMENGAVVEWRWPRMVAAAGSGVMLAIAGTVLQRLSANPMASPEVLGISGGSAIALILAIYLLPGPSQLTLVGIGTLGAVITLGLLIALNRRSGFAPAHLLLSGVAIGALFDALRSVMLVNGDPRTQQVIAWVAGSTYQTTATSATIIAVLTVALTLAVRPFTRWLDILPLGSATAGALGIHLSRARLVLLLLTALLTACATLVVGPLSFIGLLAPHMARLAGFARASMHLLGAGLIGALLMVVADWLGRQLLFPSEIPAGVIASLLGGAYFMWGLRRL
ncbi:Fe(3+)-hydroxamate ABC transporter permease FhuB [Halomonas sp. THAF12]|uniref:Fe(3+)-hydroxamate ABC transporter permease FhuB n=1 Tax=Halomonas sp. B23F22_10 TaxID=3459515 RepID=UPI00373EFAE9